MFRIPFLCTVALLTGFAAGPAWPSEPPSAVADPADEIRLLRAEVEALRAERELAREGGFYLKLDVRRHRISLVLAGVTLQEHALEGIEAGMPRVAFLRRSPPSDWSLQAHAGGGLSPPRERDRVEIVAPAPNPGGDAAALEPSPAPVPPTAEEAYSVPTRYRIVFEGGVTLEVVAAGGGRNRSFLQRATDALRLRAADVGNAVRVTPTERLRLRIALPAADAATLYRALPPGVGLIIVGAAPGWNEP